MSLYDDASLVMIPSGYKDGKLYSVKPSDGAGDFTFTRGSNLAATRVDKNGLIEKGRENLVLQSNQFDTTWGGAASTLSGQSGYDGTSDAWLITKAGLFDSRRQVITNSGIATFSVYAKAGSYDWLLLHIEDSSGDCLANFDLSTGTLGTLTNGITSKIEDIGSGWYRCSVTFNRNLSDVRIYPSESSGYTGASGSIYIQDAQLEAGLVATDYIETGATTAQAGILEDMPRLDYSGGTCPALLLEPQRTNLVTQSEYFNSSEWTINASTIVDSDSISPEGVRNAARWTSNASGTYIQDSVYVNDPSNFSVFFKYVDYPYIQLYSGASGNFYANFDIENNIIGNSGSFTSNEKIESYGDGWYRVSCTFSGVAASSSVRIGFAQSLTSGWGGLNTSAAGDILIYGAQFEAGSYPTSYIPTYGTSVTRGADSCSKTGISSLIGQTEGTFYAEINVPSIESAGVYVGFQTDDGTSSNRLSFIYYSTGRVQAVSFDGGSLVVSIDAPSYGLSAGVHKIAFAYELNNYVLYIDGGIVGTDTSATVPATSNFNLFVRNDGSIQYNEFLSFTTRLSNSDLANLTTL